MKSILSDVYKRQLIASSIIAIVPIAFATMMEHIGDICAISSTTGNNLSLIHISPSVDLDEKIVEKLSTWLSNDGKYGRSLIYVPTADMGEMPNLDDRCV